ncbi:MAG: calcium-binding protein [Cyanobacteriota bacterium]|nr:calcium-binding protein [Cyanobacteriota bacterium]
MRILFTIAHFFNSAIKGRHASERSKSRFRLQALSMNIAALHQLFGKSQNMIDIEQKLAFGANQFQQNEIDVLIFTSGDYHLLNQLQVPKKFYVHNPTNVEPLLLGFECQAVLRDYLGKYDYYCFLEDDLIIHDPWFFIKLNWFNQNLGYLNLLQPNRYEISFKGLADKAYIDGNLASRVTAPFQNVLKKSVIEGKVMNVPISFNRTLNPHAGCYFLNAEQMDYWAKKPYFLDRDTSFIGPLESAATLGIMKTFRIYKSVPEQANFLEIQHFGTAFLSLIGQKVGLATRNYEQLNLT